MGRLTAWRQEGAVFGPLLSPGVESARQLSPDVDSVPQLSPWVESGPAASSEGQLVFPTTA